MNVRILLVICVLGAACSSRPPETPAKKAPVAKPADESRRFPAKNRVRIELVDEKMLGRDFLPGGNLAEYQRNGKSYRQFLVAAPTAQKAALLLFDFKNTLTNPKYLAHMGGYFGMDNDQPVYVFAKGVFVAGIVGLTEEEADALAREFAVRL